MNPESVKNIIKVGKYDKIGDLKNLKVRTDVSNGNFDYQVGCLWIWLLGNKASKNMEKVGKRGEQIYFRPYLFC